MKNIFNLLLIMLFLSFGSVVAQTKSKKEIKAEQKANKTKETEALINSKNFDFEANFVNPQGARDINIQGERYDVKFTSDQIESYLPYFGRAFNVGYGGDGGMKFKGAPQEYSVEKKKKFYLVTCKVVGDKDTYNLSLSVYFEGSASLTINSNQRETISYSGSIEASKEVK